MKFDHSKKDILEAVGISDEDFREVSIIVGEILKLIDNPDIEYSVVVEKLYNQIKDLEMDKIVMILFAIFVMNRQMLRNSYMILALLDTIISRTSDLEEKENYKTISNLLEQIYLDGPEFTKLISDAALLIDKNYEADRKYKN